MLSLPPAKQKTQKIREQCLQKIEKDGVRIDPQIADGTSRRTVVPRVGNCLNAVSLDFCEKWRIVKKVGCFQTPDSCNVAHTDG